MLTRKRALLSGVALLTASAVSVVAASAATNMFTDPSAEHLGASFTPQSATAEASGLRLEVTKASFSASETLVVIRISRAGRAVPFSDVVVPPTAITLDGAALAEPPVSSGGDDENWILELQPILHPGAINLAVSSLSVRDDRGSSAVDGPWSLSIQGPVGDEFVKAMRVERFASTSVQIQDRTVVVNGFRSTTRTVLEYSWADDLLELAPPRLAVSSRAVDGPSDVRPLDGLRRATFAPTPWGEQVQITIGPFAISDGNQRTVTLRLEGAFTNAGLTPVDGSTVALSPNDVVAGDGSVPISATVARTTVPSVPNAMDFGRANPAGDVIALTIDMRGTWTLTQDADRPTPYTSTPGLVDARAVPLRLLSLSSGFARDSAGSVREGTTTARFFLEDGMDLSLVRLVLSGPERVVTGGAGVLSPAK